MGATTAASKQQTMASTSKPHKNKAAPPLSQQSILQAAAELVRLDGLEKLSMRRLARQLGVEAAAIYWHFRNKDELVGALLQHMSRDICPPELGDGGWRQRCETLCRYAREQIKEQPELLTTEYFGGLMSPLALQLSGVLVDLFQDEGLDAGTTIHASQYLVLTLMGVLRAETTVGGSLPSVATMAQVRLGSLAEETPESRQRHAELIAQYVLFSRDAFFEYSLQRMLDGIAQDMLAQR
jgi:TetR/AcrR family tetracycline transcriptional repressor